MYIEADNADGLSNGTYYSFSNVGNAAGVRVVVHPPNSRPSPMDQGFDVPPGYSSSVGLTVNSSASEIVCIIVISLTMAVLLRNL